MWRRILAPLCLASALHVAGAAADGPPPPPEGAAARAFVDPRPALTDPEIKNAVTSYNGSASHRRSGVIVVRPCVFYTENRYGNIQGDIHNIND